MSDQTKTVRATEATLDTTMLVPLSPEAEATLWGDDGLLTRKGMERIIGSGGSVLHKGVIVTQVKNLPTEAQLASGNAVKQAAAAHALDENIKALQAERASIYATPAPKVENKLTAAQTKAAAEAAAAQAQAEADAAALAKIEAEAAAAAAAKG